VPAFSETVAPIGDWLQCGKAHWGLGTRGIELGGVLSRQSRHTPPTSTRTLRHVRQIPICGLLRCMLVPFSSTTTDIFISLSALG
jgi:hypothetical protein